LTSKLVFAPPKAIHATAAFLYFAAESAQMDADVAEIIDQSDPRELLRIALPNCPARLYRALDTAGNSVRDQSFYTKLSDVCRGPFASALLGGDLNDRRLEFYETLQTMDPLVANLCLVLPEARHFANAVDSLVALIRSYGAIGECDFNLPKSAGTGAVLRRLQRGLYAVRAPKPPFPVPAPFHHVETIGQLRRIGRAYKNCLGQFSGLSRRYWSDLINGSVVYVTSEEPPLLIALRRIGAELWHIDQMKGPRDTSPSLAARCSIEQKLRDSGVRLVLINPGFALSHLDRAARRPRTVAIADDGEGDDLDELLDDIMD
jgi:hypothetical protein